LAKSKQHEGRTHFCDQCKKDCKLEKYQGLRLDKEDREHIFQCFECGALVDTHSPRQRAPTR